MRKNKKNPTILSRCFEDISLDNKQLEPDQTMQLRNNIDRKVPLQWIMARENDVGKKNHAPPLPLSYGVSVSGEKSYQNSRQLLQYCRATGCPAKGYSHHASVLVRWLLLMYHQNDATECNSCTAIGWKVPISRTHTQIEYSYMKVVQRWKSVP